MPRPAPDGRPRPARRAVALGCSLALVVAFAACGDGADERDVERTVNGVYDALAAKDAKGVCTSMSRAARRSYTRAGEGGPASCEAAFAFGIAFAGNSLAGVGEAAVSDVEVDGDHAVATVEYRGRRGAVRLVQEDGEWRLNTPAPPDDARG